MAACQQAPDGADEADMSNMAYCRFENTVSDLQDCLENMEGRDLSDTEARARKRLIDMCVDIALDYGSEVDRPCEEE